MGGFGWLVVGMEQALGPEIQTGRELNASDDSEQPGRGRRRRRSR
jgi:hypothetical protein